MTGAPVADPIDRASLIVNRDDDASFERVVNLPTRGVRGSRNLDIPGLNAYLDAHADDREFRGQSIYQ